MRMASPPGSREGPGNPWPVRSPSLLGQFQPLQAESSPQLPAVCRQERWSAVCPLSSSLQPLPLPSDRRNVPVIRPHSWHLAKLSEVRTETATMHFPADAFSLSWHSGCDTSDLSLPWNPLSRHCSTDKSSSLGSMESLDQPSQTYYEGSLSPIDQAMYQNKRDSAYSSFSASSNTSDSALRPEENSSAEYIQQGQLPDPRYLQTGSEGSETSGAVSVPSLTGQLSPSARPASCTQETHFPSSAKAFAPPQPPVRQDSLRACNPSPASAEVRGALPQADSLHPKGKWTSDISLCVRGRDPEGICGQLASASHTKETLSTDQYYLLSSHADRHLPMERGAQSMESLLNEEGGVPPPEEPAQRADSKEREAERGGRNNLSPFAWKACWLGHLAHRHSAPEQLLAAQLQTLNVAHSQEGPHWTVSPLHVESKTTRTQEPRLIQGHSNQSHSGQEQESDLCPVSGEGPWSPESSRTIQERPRSASVEFPPSGDTQPGLKAVPSTDALMEGGRGGEGRQPVVRKGGSAQHRSAQMRRHSDRFATNLRNEIQWRKAQLQKAKGSAILLCGEEPVQETEEPPDSPTAPAPSPPPLPSPPPAPAAPPLPAESRPHRTTGPKRWGSELSVLQGAVDPQSPSRVPSEPKWKAPLLETEKVPAALHLPSGGRGRWRWSPEHKLQPHSQSPQGPGPGSPSRPAEESGLLPFADRRKFFEETSKAPAPVHAAFHRSRPGSLHPREVDPNSFQPVSSEHRDQRRHSMDHSYGSPSSPPIYPEFRSEVSGFYKPLARHRDCECWRSLPCACATREACAYCCGERCPALLQRNMPAPSSHYAHHCHHRPWARCTDCCCPAQHKLLEEGGPWQGRKTFPQEFPVDNWEPPAINRKNSQSMRPASSLAEEAKAELSWDKEQSAASSRDPEQPAVSPSSLCSKDYESMQAGAGGDGCHPGTASPAPPFHLNSEELMRDVAGRDRSLAGVLNPSLGPVTAAEVMSDLFSPGKCEMWKRQDWKPQVAGKELPERHPAQPASPTSAGTTCSAYYSLSSGKAELLNKMKELSGASAEEEEPDHDLAQKKVQLIESISRKLAVLQEAQRGLQDDINANVILGKEVESHVKGVCKQHEFEKFRLFIGDLDKVVNLFLSLSGRLARVENALSNLDSDAPEEEKLALLEKKRQLTAQLEDAKELQEHVAQRESVVFASVSRCLPSEQLQDYQHFVRMKSALAIQQRQLDDKIKLGEEQLRCLRESLRRVPWDC
ncbi:protein Shroom4 isoform X5 [Sphaerodactylus townsendi]|uniref:protein Shroom4 isoform X5 n=1 Tax=Sphaerodactylus townsendi TaxID=933632 RepID=UPI002026C777|nr:protein Shroom4 isoform X5 [Sphaerodactylus townsendi]